MLGLQLIRPPRVMPTSLEIVLCVVGINACLARGAPASKLSPTYFKPCHKNDPNINICIRDSINSVIKQFSNVSSDLQLPALDPVEIPFLEIREGGDSDVSLDLILKHTRLVGLSNTNIINVRSNLIDRKLELVCKYSHLDMSGDFISEGAVLAVPLSASGGYSINMSDVTAIWIIYLNRADLNGASFMSIGELTVDLIPSSVTFDFGDVLDGDNGLGKAMRQFLNENSHEIFNAMKSKIQQILRVTSNDIGNNFLAQFPADVLLPD